MSGQVCVLQCNQCKMYQVNNKNISITIKYIKKNMYIGKLGQESKEMGL